MDRAQIPLNALRAFEAAARHLSFTRAAVELCVSQGAVSQQVAALEARLGTPLFRRLPRGLALTDEGQALFPVMADTLDRVGDLLERIAAGHPRDVLSLGVVGTFASGWLLERLPDFTRACPQVDLRLSTNNNRVDIAGEGLDMAIRFGGGAWHGTHAIRILDAPLTPLCTPEIAQRLSDPAMLGRETLLRSYRSDEWPTWFAQAGTPCPALRGPMFDSSVPMVDAARHGLGVALAPAVMFTGDLRAGRLVAPFATRIDAGSYWLTRLQSRTDTPAMVCFRTWLLNTVGEGGPIDRNMAQSFAPPCATPASAGATSS
ncbi:LysR family transcriptional regulator of beta-lactamase [Novosphingobium chloroacetimidivorans]|uniref:LysR family transcriptional regulator of beta-lactamase n=1 Tax=Novosphingobium chloroacetimidivorans TaxID=1428314 RepID=A0A7W7K7J8_9SPHN|nr:LysR family transcriptional regulator [Novosphingobium chloroacetimidivorans]MBB4857702.1 LysR family transcriptional regulator of beta-lactamase [Novosphingobium chloroacetimidivorans]